LRVFSGHLPNFFEIKKKLNSVKNCPKTQDDRKFLGYFGQNDGNVSAIKTGLHQS